MDDLIKKLKEKGVTAGELSKGTGIPTGRIYKWLADIGGPKYADAQKIEKFLHFIDVVPNNNNGMLVEMGNKQDDDKDKIIADQAATIKKLTDDVSRLIGLLQDANSLTLKPGYVSGVLQPFLQQLAAGLVGKQLSDAGVILKEFYRILGDQSTEHEKSGRYG